MSKKKDILQGVDVENIQALKKLPFGLFWKVLFDRLLPEFFAFYFPGLLDEYQLEAAYFPWKDDADLRYRCSHNRSAYFYEMLIRVPKLDSENLLSISMDVDDVENFNFKVSLSEFMPSGHAMFKASVSSKKLLSKILSEFNDDVEITSEGLEFVVSIRDHHVLGSSNVALKASDNPFALITLAARACLKGNKLSTKGAVQAFLWIFEKLLALKLPQNKFSAVFYFLKECFQRTLSGNKEFERMTNYINSINTSDYITNFSGLLGNSEGPANPYEEVAFIEYRIKNYSAVRMLRDTESDFTVEKIANILDVPQGWVVKLKAEEDVDKTKA